MVELEFRSIIMLDIPSGPVVRMVDSRWKTSSVEQSTDGSGATPDGARGG